MPLSSDSIFLFIDSIALEVEKVFLYDVWGQRKPNTCFNVAVSRSPQLNDKKESTQCQVHIKRMKKPRVRLHFTLNKLQILQLVLIDVRNHKGSSRQVWQRRCPHRQFHLEWVFYYSKTFREFFFRSLRFDWRHTKNWFRSWLSEGKEEKWMLLEWRSLEEFMLSTRAIGSALAFNKSKRASHSNRKKEHKEESEEMFSPQTISRHKFAFMLRNYCASFSTLFLSTYFATWKRHTNKVHWHVNKIAKVCAEQIAFQECFSKFSW